MQDEKQELTLLLPAYLETDYCVFAEPQFILHIGVASEPLAKLYRQYEASCAAFVTACNPYSQQVDGLANAARQTELRNELQQCGLKFFEGEGKHPDGNWPAEPSFLVLGLALEEAKELGKRFEQNAVVWCGANAAPELVLLRETLNKSSARGLKEVLAPTGCEPVEP